ncbi:tyrosine--tRNA ligase [Patescibacteria group bacterium AH-259-L05]|nr:tyrosine--tRNA ligase [Patescibacteria group bacterium AH-259-L05]
MTKTDKGKIEHLLSRNVEKVIAIEHLKKRLISGETLRIKHGIDPTGIDLHLGHAMVLWKLKEFQDLGHTIVLILGDYTAQIGDPSDKLYKRPFISLKQVNKNLKTYKKQIGKILNNKKVEWHRNSEWINKLRPRQLGELAELFSIGQMLARRNFRTRLKNEEEISIREFLYPLYQGYDSVAVKADVEVGGNDQLFNLLAGRKIQGAYQQEPQDIITLKMLIGTDGEKMSKTKGNIVTITDSSQEQYGKIMSMGDDLIEQYFELCTNVSLSDINKVVIAMGRGANPRDFKEKLAYEIVKLYHGENAAHQAQDEFNRVFRDKELPQDIPTYNVKKKKYLLIDLLCESGLTLSKGEARRLIKQGAVEVDKNVIDNWQYECEPKSGMIIKVGKRRFIKLML